MANIKCAACGYTHVYTDDQQKPFIKIEGTSFFERDPIETWRKHDITLIACPICFTVRAERYF